MESPIVSQLPALDAPFSVLVVEDDPNHQLLVRRALDADERFTMVEFARDSGEAEALARQIRFDCLLIDNRIPGRRGLDLASTLRGSGVDSPFVLMTSAGSEDLAVQAYRQHAADYLVKDTGFWREVPRVLARAIFDDRSRRSDAALRRELAQALDRIEGLNARFHEQHAQMVSLGVAAAGVAAAVSRSLRALAERGDATPEALTPLADALDAVGAATSLGGDADPAASSAEAAARFREAASAARWPSGGRPDGAGDA